MKSAWKMIRNSNPRVPWCSVLYGSKGMFLGGPSWSGFVVREDKLQRTGYWSGDWLMIPFVCCAIKGIKSHEHLYFNCPFSGLIWSKGD